MIKDSAYVQSLVDYIKDIKPYHSKLIDVVVEYQYEDKFSVALVEDHATELELSTYWCRRFTYDGVISKYKIVPTLFPRRSGDFHRVLRFIAGTDELKGYVDPVTPTQYLPWAYAIPANVGVLIKVNNVQKSIGIDYTLSYTDTNNLVRTYEHGNCVFAFLPGKEPIQGDVITVEYAVNDRLFISLSNYDYPGGGTFVPYINAFHADPPPGNLLYGWGGSYDIDPNADPQVPTDHGGEYDIPPYDTVGFGGLFVIDPWDYANGILNWDMGPWDGLEGELEGYSSVVDFIDDTGIPGRDGRLIGSVRRLLDDLGRFYYIFDFDTSYLADFVPVGTEIKLCTDQREAEAGWAQTNIRDDIFFAEWWTFDELINVEVIEPDNIHYIEVMALEPVTERHWFKLEQTDNDQQATASAVDVMQLISSQGTYGIDYDTFGYDLEKSDDVVAINDRTATSGYEWFYTPVVPVMKLTINHYMGDLDPTGPHANTGGVIIEVTGAAPTSISNPYINNLPPLFNTTVIEFSYPAIFTVRLVKP